MMKWLFKNPYRRLERALGYAFRRRSRLMQALAHPSYRFENAHVAEDNQRLEFLGDAALGLVAGHYLFEKYPQMQEGNLTRLRSRLTNSNVLAEAGRRIGLDEYLLLGKGERLSGGARRPSNILDAMEAIFGAAYLDGGLKAVRRIFEKVILAATPLDPEDLWADNPKGHLQVLAQKQWKTSPRYEVVSRRGPSHAQVFRVRVRVGQHLSAEGEGPSRQAAEFQAAAVLVQRIKQKEG